MASKSPVHEKASLLGDVVFAANDGVITTFAIVAGSAGASLSANVVLILGFANLFADGLSMASGKYLGAKSEMEYEEMRGGHMQDVGSPFKHGLTTFISFNIAGLFPLLPFIFNLEPKFKVSSLMVGLVLFAIGSSRGKYTKKGYIKSGVEMLAIGGLAALAAYFAGFLLDKYVV